jgi:hypothetical protein
MQQHALEFSQSLIPSFSVEVSDGKHSNPLSDFELSMLCGVMVHPASSFTIDNEGTSLSIEWAQDYPI